MSNEALQQKIQELNAWIERPQNWFIVAGGKQYPPPAFEKHRRAFYILHENIAVAAMVEMHGLGKIQKVITIGSDKYRLTEIPEEILHAVYDAILSDGEDHLSPYAGEAGISVVDPESKIPKFRIRCQWQPEGDWLKVLMERRNFLFEAEWEQIKPLMTEIYDGAGVTAPHYISGKPLVQVSKEIH